MAVKMQKEYGDSLNTVFVESQGHTMDDVQKLALQKKWFGSSAMWTTERPFNTGARGIPNFVLLSPEGEIVMKGNPISMHKKIEDYLASLKRAKVVVPSDLHKSLHGAFKDLAKGKLGKALATSEKLAADKKDDQEIGPAAADFAAKVKARIEARFTRVDRAMDAGAFSFVKDELKELGKLVKGTSLENAVGEREAKLKSKELEAEVKAEKALAKITDKLFDKGATPASKKQLLALAKKHDGTKAGTRATQLAGFLED